MLVILKTVHADQWYRTRKVEIKRVRRERERARACEHKNGSEKKSVGKERGNFIACSFTRCRSHRSFSPSKRFNSANPRCMDNGGVKSLYYMNMACTLWQNANRRVWVLNEFSLPPPNPIQLSLPFKQSLTLSLSVSCIFALSRTMRLDSWIALIWHFTSHKSVLFNNILC